MEGFGEHGGWQRVFLLCPWAFLGTVLESQVGGDVLSLAAGLLASPPQTAMGKRPASPRPLFGYQPSWCSLPSSSAPTTNKAGEVRTRGGQCW